VLIKRPRPLYSDLLVALTRAFWLIRRREIALHREWMIRAFSIGLAVATIRPIMGIFFATSRLSELTPREFFGIAFWIGFTLHLMAAEAWIRGTQSPRRRFEAVREIHTAKRGSSTA
jgi:cytochrome bd-type quinol oxidase subunit 1